MPYKVQLLGRVAVVTSLIYMAVSVAMMTFALKDPLLFAAYHADETLVLATYDLGLVRFLSNCWKGYAGILVLTYAVNAVWLYLAAENARALEPDANRMEPAWVVGWFGVPLANMVMPFRGVRETWASSVRPGTLKARAPMFLVIWWICWVASEVFGNIAFVQMSYDTMSSARMAVWLDVAQTPFLVLSGALWVWIVSDIAQSQRTARVGAAPA